MEEWNTTLGGLVSLALSCALLAGCAVTPPVQEMSDARQAIQAAVGANAQELAPADLARAEGLMHQASRSLEKGAYDRARKEAIAAKHQAITARDRSVARNGTARF